jgi:hydrogenase maturation protease
VNPGAAPRPAADPGTRVLVLGIGNLLWADEGFGVRAVEQLHAGWEFTDQVKLVDGGTQGLYLLDDVCDAQHVLVFDAIDYGLPPGTLRVLRDAEVPVWSDTTMSLHQASFMELLSLARLRGRFPQRITLIGVQPDVLDDLGGSLSDVVRAQLAQAVALGVAELERWGYPGLVRSGSPPEPLNAAPLALDAYEGGRPAASAACRIGDARFLNQVHAREPG